MTTYTVTRTCEGHCPETDLLVFSAPVTIRFTTQPAYGNGWDEPHEPAHAEMNAVVVDTKIITGGPLYEWAEKWVEDNGMDYAADAHEASRPQYDAGEMRGVA